MIMTIYWRNENTVIGKSKEPGAWESLRDGLRFPICAHVPYFDAWVLPWFAMHEWVQQCCTELFHTFSPDQLNGSVTQFNKKTRSDHCSRQLFIQSHGSGTVWILTEWIHCHRGKLMMMTICSDGMKTQPWKKRLMMKKFWRNENSHGGDDDDDDDDDDADDYVALIKWWWWKQWL